MSDQKTERLINLTMALLATKRFLSKSEIFETVAGYTGSLETKERMFERDKDDLRALGITIHVGSHDPLFEDELGYRIYENEYELELGALTPSELSYLSLAATLWRNQLFASSGEQALLKIDALAGTALREDFGHAALSLENETPLFPALWEAITTLRTIVFTYRSRSTSRRRLAPYGLTLWHGSWYLVGGLGVGLGLGLQKLAANYVSGFVILLERSVRIGDQVRISGLEGRITDIKTRYTLIRDAAGRECVLPNEMMVSEKVENLSRAHGRVLLQIHVTIDYASDVPAAQACLVEACSRASSVLKSPPPQAHLLNLGADGLEMTLAFWVDEVESAWISVKSEVNVLVLEALKSHAIVIPSTQRVVRLVREDKVREDLAH